MEDPFAVLGVSSDADEDALKQAYRERVKQAHPDQGGSLDEFIEVRTAYEQIRSENRSPDSPADGPSDDEPSTRRAPRDRDAEASDDEDEDDDFIAPTTEVTFLNYDVLTDHGWSVDDDDLFSKAISADLDDPDFGTFTVEPGESLLEAAEREGHAWPFACRGGACANCAIYLRHGEVAMPVNHVLPGEMMQGSVRLSCNAMPITDELHVVFNLKHMPDLEDLLLPPRPFEQAYADD